MRELNAVSWMSGGGRIGHVFVAEVAAGRDRRIKLKTTQRALPVRAVLVHLHLLGSDTVHSLISIRFVALKCFCSRVAGSSVCASNCPTECP